MGIETQSIWGKTTCATIWIRPQDLPTEFYDLSIVTRIGKMLGTPLKIDNCTAQASRGWHARLCILAPIGKTLPTLVLLGTHLQQIHYEDKNSLCTLGGCLGHKYNQCTDKQEPQVNTTKIGKSQQDSVNGPSKTIVYPTRLCQLAKSMPVLNNQVQLHSSTPMQPT